MIERDDPQDRALAALYREASREAPPAGLDARILAAARSTAAAPKPAAASWTNRWRIPVALAAIVVLSTTVTLLVLDEEAGRLEAPQAKRAAPPAAAESAAQPAPAPASAPPAAAEKRAEPRRKEIHKESEERARDAAPPAHAPGGGVPAARRAGCGESRSGRAGPVPVEGFRVRREQGGGRRAGSRGAARCAGSGAGPCRQCAGPARGQRGARRPGRAGPRTPAQWIADIRRLRNEGRTAEAEASLVEFRKLYPWYALPDDLKQP